MLISCTVTLYSLQISHPQRAISTTTLTPESGTRHFFCTIHRIIYNHGCDSGYFLPQGFGHQDN